MSGFGDFQAGAGRVGADLGVVSAMIGGVIFIIIAIVLAIVAFIPLASTSYEGSGKLCADGCDPGEFCDAGQCVKKNTSKKKRHLWLLLVALVLVGIAGLSIWYARWWKKEIAHNRSAQQLGGVMMETDLASAALNSFRR
jgi:H+/Cl- antiporter ClcA